MMWLLNNKLNINLPPLQLLDLFLLRPMLVFKFGSKNLLGEINLGKCETHHVQTTYSSKDIISPSMRIAVPPIRRAARLGKHIPAIEVPTSARRANYF